MSITQLDKHTMQWVSNWLRGRAQRVTSDWRSVTSGVPQGSILSPVLFIIFIKDLDAGLEGILSKFEDDTELGGTVDSFKGREALERDLEKSEDWAITNHRKFNKGKCRILQLGLCNPGCAYSLGNEMLESSATERDLGSWGQWKANENDMKITEVLNNFFASVFAGNNSFHISKAVNIDRDPGKEDSSIRREDQIQDDLRNMNIQKVMTSNKMKTRILRELGDAIAKLQHI
ncbi:hypothetical protein BTVI_13707 [Pitangus sulphuratus]|nr:hypothetical protein BTVI_13707 [Pitangus sulphuratus]